MQGPLCCHVSSFGFKYGPQNDADWVVDVRFLDNPFWVPELRPLTGLEPPVRDYVLGQPAAREFLERFSDLMTWTLERSGAHGRDRLHVALGCTGGRHRSVAMAGALADRLSDRGVAVELSHRDVGRPDPR